MEALRDEEHLALDAHTCTSGSVVSVTSFDMGQGVNDDQLGLAAGHSMELGRKESQLIS